MLRAINMVVGDNSFNQNIIFPELSYVVTGVLFAAHNKVGQFANEMQCCDAIEYYLKERKIRYEREKILPPSFPGERQGRNRIDFLIFGENGEAIIVEVKAKKILTRDDYYQMQRYLSAFNLKLGIMVNFHAKYITPKRIINSKA